MTQISFLKWRRWLPSWSQKPKRPSPMPGGIILKNHSQPKLYVGLLCYIPCSSHWLHQQFDGHSTFRTRVWEALWHDREGVSACLQATTKVIEDVELCIADVVGAMERLHQLSSSMPALEESMLWNCKNGLCHISDIPKMDHMRYSTLQVLCTSTIVPQLSSQLISHRHYPLMVWVFNLL